jgi:hypothetical protein
MSTCHSRLTASARFYQCLLRLYPPSFRLRFGVEMVKVFQDCCRTREQHPAACADFWISILRDLASSLPGEWRQALIQEGKFELPIRQWIDSLVIPSTVLAYLAVEGNLVAAAIRRPPAPPWAHGCGTGLLLACLESNGLDNTCLATTLVLALIGILIAMIIARNNRKAMWINKLYSLGNWN